MAAAKAHAANMGWHETSTRKPATIATLLPIEDPVCGFCKTQFETLTQYNEHVKLHLSDFRLPVQT
eukprot:3877162-Heterocapsa_arctica.AAC.1